MEAHFTGVDGSGNVCELQHTSSASYAKTVWMGFKPEGFPIELADVFLRTCDFAESVDIQLDTPGFLAEWRLVGPEGITSELCALHESLAAVRNWDPGHPIDGYALSGFLEQLFGLARSQKIDLLTMAELKHSYNKTRPHKHGKVL